MNKYVYKPGLLYYCSQFHLHFRDFAWLGLRKGSLSLVSSYAGEISFLPELFPF